MWRGAVLHEIVCQASGYGYGHGIGYGNRYGDGDGDGDEYGHGMIGCATLYYAMLHMSTVKQGHSDGNRYW